MSKQLEQYKSFLEMKDYEIISEIQRQRKPQYDFMYGKFDTEELSLFTISILDQVKQLAELETIDESIRFLIYRKVIIIPPRITNNAMLERTELDLSKEMKPKKKYDFWKK